METRKIAMEWWNNMSHSEKGLYMDGNFKHRHPQSLTGREIEILFDDKCKSDDGVLFERNKSRKGTQRSPFGIGS